MRGMKESQEVSFSQWVSFGHSSVFVIGLV